MHHKQTGRLSASKYIIVVLMTLFLSGGLLSACGNSTDQSAKDRSSKVTTASHSTKTTSRASMANSHQKQAVVHAKKAAKHHTSSILKRLVYYTDKESAGPTDNYYWVNGKAHLTGFNDLKAGDYHFTNDSQGRSATARAVLTYSEYRASQGSRQGDPLAPPAWPEDNPRVAINFSLTGRTYHGYLYNRSHSIADSLLGKKSYASEYNFTTGTRPQNVGANQDGGMRYAEETAENYWLNHPGTSQTISYETTPIYKGDENLPRGSVVNIKSSDDAINTEIVVINSVEGIKIDYNDGSSNAKPISNSSSRRQTRPSSSYASHRNDNVTRSTVKQHVSGYTKDGQWTVAASGMVFVSDSHKYYSRVINPGNYQYMSISQANASGATRAIRGNQYAQP